MDMQFHNLYKLKDLYNSGRSGPYIMQYIKPYKLDIRLITSNLDIMRYILYMMPYNLCIAL